METQRILFVDDDAPVRMAFSRSLRGQGFQIDLADGADQAMSLASQGTYAVIATDYRMPAMDGLDLIERLRALQPDATYMLVSGECDLDLALQAVNDHNVSFVVCKPWDVDELGATLRRSVEAHWERAGQRLVQQNMVQASKQLEAQKKALQEVLVASETRAAATLVEAMGMRGHETVAHCRRVAQYALMLAEELGLRGRILTAIAQGALLHDIGKIGIPDAILLKDGPLTESEWQVMRGHTELGARLLDGMEHLKSARDIVRQHHERWNGTGYPLGLREQEICIGARIFAVADAIEAILSDRPYRKGGDMEAVTEEILRCSGSHFDPEVVQAFSRIPAERWVEVREQHPEVTVASRIEAAA